MIFSKAANCLVYTLTEDQMIPVLATIPEARRVNGSSVAVPLTLRNSQILRHLGHEAVSPILHQYDFPSRFPKPRPNQLVTASFKTLHPRNMDVSEMRTGKTLSTLWAWDWLVQQGVLHRALIISPLSTLKRVWEDEIFTSFHGRRKAAILHGTREKRLRELSTAASAFIINPDGLTVGMKREGTKLILGELAQRIIADTSIDLIIIDEASAFKNAATNRWKILNRIIEAKPDCWVWGLTGTPAAQAPTDAHAIARLIYGKARKPESFQTFRMRTMYRVSEFKWAPQKGAEQAVYDLLQPAVRFTRKDLGFPPLSYETRDVEMTVKQKAAYAAMRKDLELWTEGNRRIDAVNEGVLRSKLIQIACGAVYGPDREIHHVDAKNRLEALDDIIEEAGGKIVVFAAFKSVVHMIRSHISKTVTCEVINGDTSAAHRNRILKDFTGSRDPQVIIADPRSLSHGVNASVADTLVWFSPIDSLEIYEQGCARIDGPGKCGVVLHLSSSPVEREIYKRLQEKKNLQGAILDLLRGG